MKWNIRELKARASALAEAHRPAVRRVVLLYCGVLAAMTLGSSGLSMYLDSRIGTTGGLDGMGLRSILQTVQEILLFANLYFGPFWSAGFLAAMIGLVRAGTRKTGIWPRASAGSAEFWATSPANG